METPRHLHILWTNDNPITAEKMVFMYALNGLKHNWWDKITIIIWGATTALTAADATIQEQLKGLVEGGVTISACKACSNELGVTDALRDLGFEVKYWGPGLTEILQSGSPLLSV
ncbi:DsrE family protein (plasmid) [Trichlorobacter lovleyi]|uniref:DsrE family protein n=1 Tax=Trichlorobacter lovleyi TaxID=313985 RepID=UPI0022406260|nr:DsrE family protein [Trichlorobacter lovleyi]QOX81021.1 DsrE family protein [Trichlorobacter lovleyi]